MLISVTGMVGAGKTTVARAIADYSKYNLIEEVVDNENNPWLSQFYEAPKQYILPLQLFYLTERAEALNRVSETGGDYVMDQSLSADFGVFVRGHFNDGLLDKDSFSLLQRVYQQYVKSPAIASPDVLVYLTGPLNIMVERIKSRGRNQEIDVPMEYWEKLYRRYDRVIEEYSLSPVVRLDVREYDLLDSPSDVQHIVDSIERASDVRFSPTPSIPKRKTGF